MSQFRSLSEGFRESMEKLGDDLGSKRSKNKPDGLGLIKAFVDGPVALWYENLQEEDRDEADRLFKELSNLDTEEVLAMVKSEKVPTPFNLVAGLFGFVKEGSKVNGVGRTNK